MVGKKKKKNPFPELIRKLALLAKSQATEYKLYNPLDKIRKMSKRRKTKKRVPPTDTLLDISSKARFSHEENWGNLASAQFNTIETWQKPIQIIPNASHQKAQREVSCQYSTVSTLKRLLSPRKEMFLVKN